MKKIPFFIILIVTTTIHSTSISRETIDRIKKATVYIKVLHTFPLTGDEVTSTGTGFFISEFGHIITNYHVVQPQLPLYGLNFPAPVIKISIIKNSGAKEYEVIPATLLARDEDNDIALLKISNVTDVPFITLDSREKLIETMSIWIFGYPFGDEFTVIQRGPEITVGKGSISALRHDDRGILSQIQIDAPVNPGNSGGPVISESGSVIGVVRMLYATGVNFVVPSHHVDSLLTDFPLTDRGNDSAVLHITTTPSDATLFLNGKSLLNTSSGNTVVCSWHHLSAMKPHYETWMRAQACCDTHTVAITLVPQKMLPIHMADKKRRNAAGSAPYPEKTGPVLLGEEFDSPEKFETWEQYTGGTCKRTWFLNKGTLNQFESDEVLHAIYIGDTAWTDYMVKARVKITSEQKDCRAGIIFRETSDGFYLFRIHQKMDKAQIAYHCKQPFGWFIIMEKKIDGDIRDTWYAMAVTASGNNIACFLDKKCIFTARADYSERGRIGFYSVESKASFDSLKVTEVVTTKNASSHSYEPGLLSFWFSDYFTQKSGWWYQYSRESSAPAPWFFGDAGCALYGTGKKTHCSEFTKYLLDDFFLDCIVSLGEGNKNSVFEIFFRKSNKGKLTLRFSKKNNKLSLLSTKAGRNRTVKRVSLPKDFFNSTNHLFLEIDKNKLVVGTSEKKFMEVNRKMFPAEHGTFGFAASNVPVVLHQMTVSSVKN